MPAGLKNLEKREMRGEIRKRFEFHDICNSRRYATIELKSDETRLLVRVCGDRENREM